MKVRLALLLLALGFPFAPDVAAQRDAARQQRRVVVRRYNGRPVVDIAYLGDSIASAKLRLGKDIPLLADLAELSTLQIRQAVDADLDGLKSLDKLRSLDLTGTKITNHGLKALSALAQLEELDLTGAEIDDAGLPDLAKLVRLRRLVLSRTNIARIDALTGLAELGELGVAHTAVTDQSLKAIAHLPRLTVTVHGPA